MSDSGLLQVAREAVKLPSLLVDIYGDLAKPGVKQVGMALETVIGFGNTILWPLTLANARSRMALERNLENYRLRLEQVAPGDVVKVPPEVGVPIAEKLAYVTDSHLSALYVALLATASSLKTMEYVHPSFVHVVDHLAPDEAIVLENFGGPEFVIPTVSAIWNSAESNDTIWDSSLSVLLSGGLSSNLRYPHRLPAYISNLSGLGLLEFDSTQELSDPSGIYDILETHWREKIGTNSSHPERTLAFRRGFIASTQFGEQFYHSCHAAPNES